MDEIKIIYRILKDFQTLLVMVLAGLTYLIKKRIDNTYYANNYKEKIIIDKSIENYTVLCQSLSNFRSAVLTFVAEKKQIKTIDTQKLTIIKGSLAEEINCIEKILFSLFPFIDLDIYQDLLDFIRLVSKNIESTDFDINFQEIELKILTINSKITKKIKDTSPNRIQI